MTDSQLIIALIIVGLTIIVPIIYSFKKKFEKRKLEEKLKESIYVTEKEKIRVYLDTINESTRAKHR
jgi:uncharacterized membrane protein YvbJ